MKCAAPAPIESWSTAHSLNLFNMPQKAMDVTEQERAAFLLSLSPLLGFLNAGGTNQQDMDAASTSVLCLTRARLSVSFRWPAVTVDGCFLCSARDGLLHDICPQIFMSR